MSSASDMSPGHRRRRWRRHRATRALYRRLLAEARGYRRHITGIFTVTMLSAPLTLLTPVPVKIAVDSVVGSDPLPGFLDVLFPDALTQSSTAILLTAAVMFVLVALLAQVQELASLLMSTYVGERLVLRFRARLFDHVQRLSLSYHESKGVTDSTYRIQYDAPSIQYVLVEALIPLVAAASTVAGMIYVTALIDWQLALVAVGAAPALFLITRSFGWRLRGRWHEAKNLETSALSVVQEALGALRVVKAFGQEEREKERFLDRSGEGMRARIRLSFGEGAFALLVGLTTAVATALVLYVGIKHVQSGVITLGELFLILGYIAQISTPLETMSRKMADLQASLASAERAFSILDVTHDLEQRPHAKRLDRARGAVAVEGVSFGYDGQPVLHDVSFAVQPGTRLGIVGTTGAGKTTLTGLLTRFYDPQLGQVLLDGVDVRDIRLEDLREQFAIVLQEPVLFSTSVAENIAYARPGASRADIEAAATAAGAHDFIRALPDGYETPVGERGMRLSGGERQRISLARAFLKDAPILILDEPTSAVDVHTEAAIMEAMDRLMVGRTVFLITHRPSTLERCDGRLRLEGGRVVSRPPDRVTTA